MSHRFVFLRVLFIAITIIMITSKATSAPLSTLDEYKGFIFYCTEADFTVCNQPGNLNRYMTYSGYIKGVVAAEWPSPGNEIYNVSGQEALKAGTVTARTFSERSITGGCGAKLVGMTHYNPLVPPFYFQPMWYLQRFDASKIKNEHQLARQDTNGHIMYRNRDNQLPCAFYKSDTGNPTVANGFGNDTEILLSVPDPVDTNRPVFVSPWNNAHRAGLSQNGTAAWEKAPSGIKWNYCQMLSHYYANVKIDGCGNEQYRWVWLDVGDTIVHKGLELRDPVTNDITGGDEYYGPTFNAPNTMEMGQNYSFNIHLQNTSTVKWWRFGGNWTRIGLYWDGNRGTGHGSARSVLRQTAP